MACAKGLCSATIAIAGCTRPFPCRNGRLFTCTQDQGQNSYYRRNCAYFGVPPSNDNPAYLPRVIIPIPPSDNEWSAAPGSTMPIQITSIKGILYSCCSFLC